MNAIWCARTGLALVASLAACGSADPGRNPLAAPPAIDGTLDINQLTSEQLGQLCDWYAQMVAGGYGPVLCGSGLTSPTSGSQGTCVEYSLDANRDCSDSVDKWIACAKKLGAADPCDSEAVSAADASDECRYLTAHVDIDDHQDCYPIN